MANERDVTRKLDFFEISFPLGQGLHVHVPYVSCTFFHSATFSHEFYSEIIFLDRLQSRPGVCHDRKNLHTSNDFQTS